MPALPTVGGSNNTWGTENNDYHLVSHNASGHFQPLGPRPWIDVRSYGAVGNGSTDDTTAINNAINAAPAGGAIIYCPGAVYRIDGTLDLRDQPNVELRGDGGCREVYASDPTTGTIFKRVIGVGTMLRMGSTTAPTSSTPAQRLVGISFLCNDLAATGVLIESLWHGKLDDVFIKNATTVGLDINTVNLTSVEDTQGCWFGNIGIRADSTAAASAIGMRCGSYATGGGNTSINTFENIKIYHKNGVGLQMGDTDTNLVVSASVTRAAGGTGIGVELKGSGTAFSGHCRHNTFSFLEAGLGGLTSRGTALTQPAVSNTVGVYSRGNSTPVPTIETGSTLIWQETTGGMTLYGSGSSGIGLNMAGTYVGAALSFPGSYTGYPIDLAAGGTYPTAVMRLPNNKGIFARNNANSTDLQVIVLNTLDEVQFTQALRTAGITISGGSNISLSTSTGTKIGTAITQLLGFYNATPIAQRAGAAQVAVATTASTSTTPFGYTTAAQADAIVALVNELRAWAVAQGFIKGAA